MGEGNQPSMDRIRQLARLLAETDPGPAAELGTELADAVAALSMRVDALWQLISAVVESAGLSGPPASSPPPEFVQALTRARGTGKRGVQLKIDGRDWIAALSQQPPAPDPASWSAIARLARESTDQDEM